MGVAKAAIIARQMEPPYTMLIIVHVVFLPGRSGGGGVAKAAIIAHQMEPPYTMLIIVHVVFLPGRSGGSRPSRGSKGRHYCTPDGATLHHAFHFICRLFLFCSLHSSVQKQTFFVSSQINCETSP